LPRPVSIAFVWKRDGVGGCINRDAKLCKETFATKIHTASQMRSCSRQHPTRGVGLHGGSPRPLWADVSIAMQNHCKGIFVTKIHARIQMKSRLRQHPTRGWGYRGHGSIIPLHGHCSGEAANFFSPDFPKCTRRFHENRLLCADHDHRSRVAITSLSIPTPNFDSWFCL